MQRVDAAIANQRQHEREVLAEIIVGVVAGQPLDDGGTGLATRGAQPERGIASQVALLAGLDELGQRRIRRRVAVQRERGQALFARAVLLALGSAPARYRGPAAAISATL